MERMKHHNDRKPNFYDKDGRFCLVRCFACTPYVGRENWALAVANGVCAFCGWDFYKIAERGETYPEQSAKV
jgi:hypothetical protein